MKRKLTFESMESRRLLAAELGQDSDDVFVEPVVSASETEVISQSSASLGPIDGTRGLRSQLGWFNRYDRIGFSLEREGQFSVEVGNFVRDVDLYLTNAAGQVIASSTRDGLAAESIRVGLEAGDYFVWTFATSFWSTSYSAVLHANLVDPVAPPELPGNPSTGSPDAGGGRLTEVDYFGTSRDWGLNAIGAPEAWAAGYRGQGVTVAVVDTGVDLDHPDLVNNLFANPGEIPGNGIDDDGNGFVDDVHGYDFADGDADPNDINGHGTHVAGTIAAADNGFGATGVAPEATILPVKVLGDSGSGRSSSVAAGIRYAADLGADIINLSLGGGYSSAIESAIRYAEAAGSLIVAAAGNESSALPGFPARFSASYDHVISVGAHDRSGSIAGFSNAVGGSQALQVDAPGVGIYSTYAGGGFASLSGTSMAAPHVAALAALAVSADPTLTAPELRNSIAAGVIGNAAGSDAIGLASSLETVALAAAGIAVEANFGSGLSTSGQTTDVTVSVTPDRRVAIGNATNTRRFNGAKTDDMFDRTPSELLSGFKLSSFEQPRHEVPEVKGVSGASHSEDEAESQIASIDEWFSSDHDVV